MLTAAVNSRKKINQKLKIIKKITKLLGAVNMDYKLTAVGLFFIKKYVFYGISVSNLKKFQLLKMYFSIFNIFKCLHLHIFNTYFGFGPLYLAGSPFFYILLFQTKRLRPM